MNLLSFFTQQCIMPMWANIVLSFFAGMGVVFFPLYLCKMRQLRKTKDAFREKQILLIQERKYLQEIRDDIDKKKTEHKTEIEVLKQATKDYESAKQVLDETIAKLEAEKQALEKQTLELKQANIHRKGLLAALKAQTETIKKEKKALSKAKKKNEDSQE